MFNPLLKFSSLDRTGSGARYTTEQTQKEYTMDDNISPIHSQIGSQTQVIS